MANPLEQILAALFQGGAQPTPARGMAGGMLDVNDAPLAGLSGAPMGRMNATQAMAAPNPPPMAPNATGGQSGGLGNMLGTLLTPKRSGRNQTIQWLQQQGMDEGTATLMAGNKPALQRYLLERSQPADPMNALKLEKTQLEIDRLRNPTTDDISEYQAARKEGYTGNLQQWIIDSKKAGATNVTVGGGKFGTIPPGYELVEGPDGAIMRPIPGGPAEQEAQEAEKAAGAKQKLSEKYANVVVEDIDRAVKKIEAAPWFTTGLLGDWSRGIAGTPANRVSRLLDTVKANAGFDRLQEMRDASPTGGALGQVSNIELGLLQSAIGSLEQSQSAEDLIFNLRRVQDIYNDIIHGPGNRPNAKKSDLPEGVTEEDMQHTMKKHGLTREQVLEQLNAP